MREYERVESIEMQTRPQQQPNQRFDQEASEVYASSSSKEANVGQDPGYQNEVHHHRDLFRRPFKGKDWIEKFLNPYDGQLCDLIVQSSDEVYNGDSRARWLRTGLRNGSPWIIRLSNWAMSRDHGSEDRVGTDIGTATLRWIPACLGLTIILSFPIEVAATPSNMGRYDPFLYKDWRYPLDARNKKENKGETQSDSVEIKRAVKPTYLCFISSGRISRSSVSEMRRLHGNMTPTDFVFVSFTGEHYKHPSGSFDNEYLAEVGRHAANAAGASAYWISTSCLFNPSETDMEKREREKQENCWKIGDIVRRARGVVIAVPGPLDQPNDKSLREWGERVWTIPELLLYTGKDPIYVYEASRTLDERRSFSRREVWDKVWGDHADSGQLIDHYEGSLILSPLELVTVALRCLFRRKRKTYAEGDHSYALMGLLRQRPNVVITDSDFQAFARLSLANDSNLLMERMICLLPEHLDNNWWSLDDFWNVELWDIDPKTQICGIGENDTVILDGARGAAIRWDKFIPVLTLGQESMRHRLSRWIVRGAPGIFVIMLFPVIIDLAVTIHERAEDNDESHKRPSYNIPFLVASAVILGFSGIVILCSPYLIHLIYCAKVRDSQPLFFGIEGYLDIKKLELLILGSYEGRLQWSTASSPLSCHELDESGMEKDFFQGTDETKIKSLMETENMYTGSDPVEKDHRIKERVKQAKTSSHLEKKVFTLLDTHTMTVTLFEAVRPPVAVVICGAEGGMQRALLCSQDWPSGTLYRETVLRMETRVWDRMDTLSRVRLGLKRRDKRNEIKDPRDFKVQKGALWKRFLYAIGARL